MLKNIKGAIFDLDGTLVDSLILWDVIWEELGNRFLDGAKIVPAEADDKAVRTMTLKDAMDYIHSVYSVGEDGEELQEVVNEIIENFYAKEVKLKDGVLEFLECCYKKGIKMCIASASEKKFINIAVKHCSIEKYFDGIMSCSEVGKGKDEPDIYLKALDFLGTKKEETCVFEDSHIAIATANGIGMKTVGIYDKFNYGHDAMKKIATEYIEDGETLEKLINDKEQYHEN